MDMSGRKPGRLTELTEDERAELKRSHEASPWIAEGLELGGQIPLVINVLALAGAVALLTLTLFPPRGADEVPRMLAGSRQASTTPAASRVAEHRLTASARLSTEDWRAALNRDRGLPRPARRARCWTRSPARARTDSSPTRSPTP